MNVGGRTEENCNGVNRKFCKLKERRNYHRNP